MRFLLLIMVAALGCKDDLSMEIAKRAICEGENCSIYRAPPFALTMTVEQPYTNSKAPLVRWQPGKDEAYVSYTLRVATDEACRQVLKTIELTGKEQAVDGLEEGTFYFCLDGVTRGTNFVLPAENNGLDIVIDRTAPRIQSSARLFLNSSRAPEVNIEEPHLASCSWASSTAALVIARENDVSSPMWGTLDGEYATTLYCRDQAGNESARPISIVWDTQGPAIAPFAPLATTAPLRLNPTVSAAPTDRFQWSIITSPTDGDLSFDNSEQLNPEIRATVLGTYQLRLEATDLAGNRSEQDLVVEWQAVPELTVNAGADRFLRVASPLQATVANATSLSWSQVSGPGTVSFSSTSSEDPTVSATVEGTYVLQLSANDGSRTSTDTMTLVWDTTPPLVNAGADINTRLAVTIDATSSGAASFAWSQVSGPGSLGFTSPTAEDTSITASTDGVYVARLTATDAAGNTASDELQFTWDTTAPTVNAGPDRTASTAITLDGSSTGASTFTWSLVSGPGLLSFGSANAEDTTVSASADGNYTVRLTAADAVGNSTSDTMFLTWDTTAPLVNAGDDILTNTSFLVNGTTSGGSTFAWSQVSGPGTITFGSASTEDTTATASIDGTYILRLTVTDTAGLSASDDVQFIWDTTAPSVNVGADRSVNAVSTIDASSSGATSFLWTQRSGPGIITFGSSTAEDTTVSASLDGIYVLRLTTTDAAGNTSFDELILTWDTTAPSVNAGIDRTANAVITLDATVTGATSYAWTQVSGPGTISFGSANAEDSTVSASVDGTYTLRLTASDAVGNSANDTMTLTWDTTPPSVNVGADITANSSTSINASTSGASTYAWTQVSGPGSITFGSATAEDTTASASAEGTYVIRLTATDSAGLSAFDELQFVWDTTAPSVNAGIDLASNVQVSIDATVTGGSSYQWTQVSGPGTITFGSATAIDTTASASVDGTYVLRLTSLDAASNSASDDMTLTWDTTAPSVDAGTDRTATATITLNATVTGAISYAWTQVSGPGTISFGSANAEDSTVSASVDGTYTLRLTASDAVGNSANDTMVLTWDTTPPSVSAGADILARNTHSINAVTSGGTTFAWTQVSGPGIITFGTANAEDTTVAASTDGVYILRLSVSDAAGLSASDDVQLTWDTTAPSVSAGVDVLSNASVLLNATVSGAATFAWTQISGPGTATFGSASTEDTSVSANTDGSYVLRLTASDAAGNAAFDEMTLTWDTTAPTATITGAPTGTSSTSSLNITVGGSGVTQYRYAIITGSAVCSAATYSNSIAVSTLITDNISALGAGTVTVCVLGLDSAGNLQAAGSATSANWTRTTGSTTANVPSGLALTADDAALSLTWNKDGTQSGFLVLRKTSAVTETPTDSTSYTVGQSIGSATVVYVGSNAGFANASLVNGTTYHYAVFAYDTSTRYTAATATNGTPAACAGSGVGPTAPTYITAVPGKTRGYLHWGVGGTGTSGYLVLRQTGAIVCDVPVSGTNYSVGNTIGSSTVVYKGTLEGFNDSSLTNAVAYHYRVFAYNTSNQYGSGIATTLTPRAFNLAASFTNAGYNAANGHGAHFLMAEKGVTYLAAQDRGIKTFDVSVPIAANTTFPAYTDNNLGSGGATYFFDKKGSYLYVGDYDNGLRIVNASTPKTSLTISGSLSLPAITGVWVDGNFAYMTSEETQGNGMSATRVGGLRIANVSNPASPSSVSSIQVSGGMGLEVQKMGHYVYVSYRSASLSPTPTWFGIKVFNVSNPASPTEVASIPLQNVEGLRVFGSYLIATVANVASSHDGIHIYSLANPASPSLIGSATIGETSELIDVTVLGDYAFTTSYNSKMIEVFDISDKTSPSNVFSMSTSTYSPLYINNDGQRILHSIQFGGFDMTQVFTEESVPMPPEAWDLTRSAGSASFTWRNGGGSTNSYIVLKSSSPITTAPTNGVSYSVGQTIGGATVAAVSSSTSYTESSIPSEQGYYIAIYAVDASLNYSASPIRTFAY